MTTTADNGYESDVEMQSWGDDGVPNDADSTDLKTVIQDEVNQTLQLQNACLEDSKFMLIIIDSRTFKKFNTAIAKILRECLWKITIEDGFKGICTRSMNEEQTCMVLAYFACEVIQTSPNPEDNQFMVYMDAFSNHLRPIRATSAVGLRSHIDSDNLEIFGINKPTKTFNYDSVMHTMNPGDTEDLGDILAMKYDFSITMEKNELADIIGYAKDMDADSFTIRIQQLKNQTGVKRVNKTVFEIRGPQGDQQNHKFYSMSEWNEKPVPDSTNNLCHSMMQLSSSTEGEWPKDEEFEDVYVDQFNRKLFHDFLRSIEQPNITLRLNTGKPMIIYTPMGNAGSKIYYFICAKVADDDSER